MARPHLNVARHVAPAFQALLDELSSALEVNSRVAEAHRVSTFPGARSSLARQVQHVLNKSEESTKVVQPGADACWFAGEAAYQPGQEWCSGLLFLFASGHFRRYASVLVAANESSIPRHRKTSWIAAMRSACDPTVMVTPEQYAAELKSKGVSDTSARRAVKDFIARGCVRDRPDRRTVTLSPEERAALLDAFSDQTVVRTPQLEVLFATCAFAETADGGIAVQRDIASTPLWYFFTSNGPGW